MPMYLLDSSVAACILRRDNKRVLRRLAELTPGDVGISAITRGELEFAARMSRWTDRDAAAVKLLLEHVVVLEYPGEAAEHYGEIREALHWKELEMSVPDAQAAAHARCLGLTLVTERTREFAKVPRLRVECWSA
jgi:tRNA(fMet)-specific endonuclease VapC